MKIIYLILFILIVSVETFAQNNLAWAKEFGGSGVNSGSIVQVDDLGNSYMAGGYPTSGISFGSITLSGSGSSENAFITKFDTQGDAVWAIRCKRTGGFDDQDNPDKLAVDALGNVYIVGLYLDGATIGPMLIPGNFGYFLAKLNNAGVPQWVKTFTTPDNINAATISVFVNNQQQINVLGLYNTAITFDGGNTLLNTGDNTLGNAFLTKYDASGNFFTAVELGTLNPAPFNPSAGFVPEFFRLGKDGNFYRLVKNESIVKKYDDSGTLLFTKALSLTGILNLWDIAADVAGNIFVNAYYEGDISIEGELFDCQLNGGQAIGASVFFKLDSAGNFQWGKSVVSNPRTMYFKIRPDAIGNIYLSGAEAVQTGTVSLVIAKYNPDGNLMWNQFIYPNDIPAMIFGEALARNIVLAKDGGNVLFMGYYKRYLRFDPNTIFQSNATTWRIFLAQYGLCTNNAIPVISSAGTSFCSGDSLVLTSSSSAAYLWSTGDTTSQITVTASGNYHVFSIENVECYTQSASIQIEELPLPDSTVTQNNVTLTATGLGTYQWINCATNQPIQTETNASFTPAVSGNYAVVITGANGCANTSQCTAVNILEIDENEWAKTVSLYPNPAINEIILSSRAELKTIIISNVLGQKILETEGNKIYVADFSSGIYFITAETEYGKLTGKFVKE